MHVSGLFIYPIKSCKGIAVEATQLSLQGLVHDREWAVVDLATGKVLTQREEPKLCLVTTDIVDEALVISAPDQLTMHLFLDGHWPDEREVTVHDSRCVATDQGVTAGLWFSYLLNRDVTLVRMPYGDLGRRTPGAFPRGIGFADAYELLVISEASLADLNGRLETPLPMDRFRPNIVVAGCEPYAEDTWQEISIAGGVHLEGMTHCARCVITTTDQASAARGKEPLKTLASYRRRSEGVVFGRNFNGMNGGCLQVGDAVEIVR